MKLCVYQGSFNPIHNAHLAMAKYACDNFDFDKILFIPAFLPPHKTLQNDNPYARLEMVKLAFEGLPKSEVSDIEFKKGSVSYTYNTICELYKTYKIDGKILFIIGEDAFEKIESWYESDKLKTLVKFIVFPRSWNLLPSHFTKLEKKGYNYSVANMSFIDISSTEIRNDIAQGQKYEDYLPKKVSEYIEQNGLYRQN